GRSCEPSSLLLQEADMSRGGPFTPPRTRRPILEAEGCPQGEKVVGEMLMTGRHGRRRCRRHDWLVVVEAAPTVLGDDLQVLEDEPLQSADHLPLTGPDDAGDPAIGGFIPTGPAGPISMPPQGCQPR